MVVQLFVKVGQVDKHYLCHLRLHILGLVASSSYQSIYILWFLLSTKEIIHQVVLSELWHYMAVCADIFETCFPMQVVSGIFEKNVRM